MHCAVDVKKNIRLTLYGLLCALAVSALAVAPTRAVDSVVNSTVCNPNSGSLATLAIDNPITDSVVSSSSLTVEGTVEWVSQIGVEVDGNYDQTISIPTGQTTFTTTVQLSAGTHTIVLTGNDICGLADPSDTVVITYQANTTPTTGPETPTTVNPGGTAPDAGSGAPQAPSGSIPEWVKELPLVPESFAVAQFTSRALDFDELSKDGLSRAVARFALFTVGAGLLAFGPAILWWFERRRPVEAATGLSTTAVVSHLNRNNWLVRLIGVVLMLLAFLI